MRQHDAGIGDEPAPVPGMARALAQRELEVEVERAPRAKEERGPARLQARSVGGDQHVGLERRLLPLAKRLQSGRSDLFAGLHEELHVEAEAPARAQHGLERGKVDAVLPLVVGSAAAVDALALARELPGLEARAPLALLSAYHVAVRVAEHGRQPLVLDALGDEERAVLAGGVARDAAFEAHVLKGFGDLGLEIARELRRARRVLALRRDRHPPCEILREAPLVEIALGSEDGLRAAHLGSIARDHGRNPGRSSVARA